MQAICSSFPQLGLKGSFEMRECQAEMDHPAADTVLKKLIYFSMLSNIEFEGFTR